MSDNINVSESSTQKNSHKSGLIQNDLIAKIRKSWRRFVLFHISFLALVGFLFTIFFCAILVLNSSKYVSVESGYICVILMLLGMVIYRIALGDTKRSDSSKTLNRIFSAQLALGIMAFIQIIFWMIDYQNPIHEPRSVFLVTLSAFFAYFKGKFISFFFSHIASPKIHSHDTLITNSTSNSSMSAQLDER